MLKVMTLHSLGKIRSLPRVVTYSDFETARTKKNSQTLRYPDPLNRSQVQILLVDSQKVAGMLE